MRTATVAAAFSLAALALSACATPGTESTTSAYAAELERLQSQCTARGGILTPTRVLPPSAQLTGQPSADYDCTIRGGASRLP